MNSQHEVKVNITSKNGSLIRLKDTKVRQEVLRVESKKLIQIAPKQEKSEFSKTMESFRDRVKKYEWKRSIPFQRSTMHWRTSLSKPPLLYKKERTSSYMQFILSIFGAVGIGAIMGLSILSFFFSGASTRSGEVLKASPVAMVTKQSQVKMPSLQAVMLQVGSFSEHEGARKTVEEYQARGVGVVMSHASPFRVFLGVAANEAEAKKMVEMYKKKYSIDVYPRKLEMNDIFLLNANQVRLKDVIQKGHEFVSIATQQSASHMLTGSMAENQDLVKLQQGFQEEYKETVSLLPKSSQGSFTQMNVALENATEGMRLHNMEKVQEALLQYITSYKEISELLK